MEQNLKENTNERDNNAFIVRSMSVASTLCCDYPHLKDLIEVQRNRYRNNRFIWIFSKSDELIQHFYEIVENYKKNRDVAKGGDVANEN